MCLPFILVSHGLHTLFFRCNRVGSVQFFDWHWWNCISLFLLLVASACNTICISSLDTHTSAYSSILWFCWLLNGPYTFIPQSYQHFHLKFLFDDRRVYLWIGDLWRLKSSMIPYRTIRSLSEMCILWRHCGSYPTEGDRRWKERIDVPPNEFRWQQQTIPICLVWPHF